MSFTTNRCRYCFIRSANTSETSPILRLNSTMNLDVGHFSTTVAAVLNTKDLSHLGERPSRHILQSASVLLMLTVVPWLGVKDTGQKAEIDSLI